MHVQVLRTERTLDLAERLRLIAEALELAIATHRPDVIAVERVFSQSNVMTVMGTAQASGVAVLVGARAGLPVALHTPTEVKAAVTGSGRAGKAQVTTMVSKILGLDEQPRPADAADALALAICQLWRGVPVEGTVCAATSSRATPAQLAWAEAARRASGRSAWPVR